MLIPLLLRLATPSGVSDWHLNLPERNRVEVRPLSAAEVQARLGELGLGVPDADCAPGDQVPLAARPGGYEITLESLAGLDYATLRPVRALRPGDTVDLSETYSDREALRFWQGCIVAQPPETFDYVGEARGSEFYRAALTLLFIGELT